MGIQAWITIALILAAVAYLVASWWPRRRPQGKGGGCSSCSSCCPTRDEKKSNCP